MTRLLRRLRYLLQPCRRCLRTHDHGCHWRSTRLPRSAGSSTRRSRPGSAPWEQSTPSRWRASIPWAPVTPGHWPSTGVRPPATRSRRACSRWFQRSLGTLLGAFVFLVGIEPFDAPTLLVVAVLLCGIALGASVVPARAAGGSPSNAPRRPATLRRQQRVHQFDEPVFPPSAHSQVASGGTPRCAGPMKWLRGVRSLRRRT